MRGALIIGLVVVLLIIGLLVMKNMGVDNSSGVTETQGKKHIERAESAADNVKERLRDINKRAQEAD